MPVRDFPPFSSLRDFLAHLAAAKVLTRIGEPVSLAHELTEVHRRVLGARGPALSFDRAHHDNGSPATMPVLVNLFGTVDRVAAGMGIRRERLGELGEALAYLRAPNPPNGLRDALARWPALRAALNTRARVVERPVAQSEIRRGADVDLGSLPAQTCWPGEPAPLITWPLVITRPPDADVADITRTNVGVYRAQIIGRDKLIVRWLPHRGGAAHHRAWASQSRDMPVAIVVGADPATMLAAALPLPDGLSELNFSGLLRGERLRMSSAVSVPLAIPAEAEIVIEGWVSASETAPEGPFGDHTGYFNAVADFPVMRVTAITCRSDPIYVSTYTGRPPDEPSIIGEAFNALVEPLIRQQMPEIVAVQLPSAACSYRIAVVSIAKRYPGHAKRVMMGLWGMLPQFSYTKAIVVVDDDIDVRNGADVLWAMSTRMDAVRDLTVLDRTPIDYLDFASPLPGLGGKIGLDATVKIGSEAGREWGRPIKMSADVMSRIDDLWPRLGIDLPSRAEGTSV